MLLIFNVLRNTFGRFGWSFRKGPQDRIRDKDIVAWWSTFAYLLFRIVLSNGCKDDGFLASWGLSILLLVPESFFFCFLLLFVFVDFRCKDKGISLDKRALVAIWPSVVVSSLHSPVQEADTKLSSSLREILPPFLFSSTTFLRRGLNILYIFSFPTWRKFS